MKGTKDGCSAKLLNLSVNRTLWFGSGYFFLLQFYQKIDQNR